MPIIGDTASASLTATGWTRDVARNCMITVDRWCHHHWTWMATSSSTERYRRLTTKVKISPLNLVHRPMAISRPIHIVGEANGKSFEHVVQDRRHGKDRETIFLLCMDTHSIANLGTPAVNTWGRSPSTLNFDFAGLTAAQQALVASAVQAGANSTAGNFTLDGQTYNWCPFMKGHGDLQSYSPWQRRNGFPLPGVFFPGGNGRPGYFIDQANLTTNPYYLTNAATVRLTGSIAEPQGRLTIEPGWTLVVGAQLTRLVAGSSMQQTTVYDDLFNGSPTSGQSIQIQAAQAHTRRKRRRRERQHSVACPVRSLSIIQNENVALPNLTGSAV